MKSAIRVENLSKHYVLGKKIQEGLSFRESLSNVAKRISQPSGKDFWALQNIAFEVRQGDRLGIVGKNGAGKSTLLKILSRITAPTKGRIGINGRVASLLEVGTGFHPELTGRENIFLNGAILGMSRIEIKKKLDEIVAFAEIEQFLDTPVKKYSSGMYVRLAFSVAAHLETEILIVDEVLAVGDMSFQKKCLGRMESIGKDGRTIILVSHNNGALSSICNKGILLQNGALVGEGGIDKVLSLYSETQNESKQSWLGTAGDATVKVYRTWVSTPSSLWKTSDEIEVGIEMESTKEYDGLVVGFTLFSQYGYELAYTVFNDDKHDSPPMGRHIKTFRLPKNHLASGTYKIEFDLGVHMVRKIDVSACDLEFRLENIDGVGRQFPTPEVRGRTSLFRGVFKTN